MPELPEVEVLRRSLEPHVVGRRFAKIEVYAPALREPLDARGLRRRLAGKRILALDRRAKYLLIRLEGGRTLVVHLGMSGRFTLGPAPTERAAHEHLRFGLSDGTTLRFRDPRRFGMVFDLQDRALESDRHFAHLGLEPLGDEFSGEAMWSRSRGRRAPVKSFLMDARIVVGVGNIYTTETLYRAGVSPKRAAGRISKERWNVLAETAVAVLEQAIGEGGTTLNDFRNGEGDSGYFQISLDAYGREGLPCRRCSGPIRRITQSGRSTFYCVKCQR